MSVIARLIDRVRLRHAPAQLLEATRLYRDMSYEGMVLGNMLGHAIHRHRDMRKLLTQMRRADPSDDARLDALLDEVRRNHREFARIRELDEPITRYDERGEPIAPPEEQPPAR